MATSFYAFNANVADGKVTVFISEPEPDQLYQPTADASGNGILEVNEIFMLRTSSGIVPNMKYIGTFANGVVFYDGSFYRVLVEEKVVTGGLVYDLQEVSYEGGLAPLPCFLAGSLIETARGAVAVEALVEGDQLKTLSGRFAPLKWSGHRKVSPRLASAAPGKSLPIRFAAGSLAEGLPKRDLWLSPDHCLYHDGILVQAKELVNGATVTQEHPGREITYFHLLLDRHDVIFAEGAASETYRPCNNIFGFHNAETFPEGVARNQPRKTGCFPVQKSGPKVEALKAQLSARAEAQAVVTECRVA